MMMENEDVQDDFARLSSDWTVQDELVNKLEKFLCRLNGDMQSDNIDDVHHKKNCFKTFDLRRVCPQHLLLVARVNFHTAI